MKQVVYACIAVLFYAVGNVITEQKLKPYTQFATMICCYLPMLVMTAGALALMKSRGQTISFPAGEAFYVAGLIAIVFFIADGFFFSAYTNNADAFTVSSIAVMFPAAASLMKFAWTRQVPNRYQIAAYVVAVIAVVLSERGTVTQNTFTP
jgi:drug/metabolite transporter (DMT)-like permease